MILGTTPHLRYSLTVDDRPRGHVDVVDEGDDDRLTKYYLEITWWKTTTGKEEEDDNENATIMDPPHAADGVVDM